MVKRFPTTRKLLELFGRALVLAGDTRGQSRRANVRWRCAKRKWTQSADRTSKYQVARIFIQAGQYERALDSSSRSFQSPAISRPGGCGSTRCSRRCEGILASNG